MMPSMQSTRLLARFHNLTAHISPILKQVQTPNSRFVRYTIGSALLGAPPGAHFCSASRANDFSSSTDIPRLKVVLDVDECLIHSIFDEDIGYRQDEDRPDLHPSQQPGKEEQFKLVMHDGETCMVNKRPGLSHFLEEVCKHYDVYAFTAGMELYASPLLDILDPKGLLKGRFYRTDCQLSRGGYYLKNLTIIDEDLRRIVLVDNNPVSFLCQPSNGIPVPSFYNDKEDDAFSNVLAVLHNIKDAPDVRVPLDKMFQLKESLQPHIVRILGQEYFDEVAQPGATAAVTEEKSG